MKLVKKITDILLEGNYINTNNFNKKISKVLFKFFNGKVSELHYSGDKAKEFVDKDNIKLINYISKIKFNILPNIK